MPGRTCLVLLVGFVGGISPVQAGDELARVIQPATRGGLHSDFSADNPIGRFMDLLAEGAVVEARSLQPQVCDAWARRDGAARALSGRFFVNGVELSLDRLCGS